MIIYKAYQRLTYVYFLFFSITDNWKKLSKLIGWNNCPQGTFVSNYIVMDQKFNLFPCITLLMNNSIITQFFYIIEICSDQKIHWGSTPESNESK